MLWNSAYETGIGIVDEQHKELFRQIDILVENKEPNAVPKVIDFLGQYVVKHFSTEEGLQRKCNYSDFVEHKKKHVAFVDAFTRLKKEYEESGQNSLILMKLTRVALDWLKQHIRVEDKRFAGHYLTVFPEEAKAGKPAGLGLAAMAGNASAGKGGVNLGTGKTMGTAGKTAPAGMAKPAAKTLGGLPAAPAATARRQPSTLLKKTGTASSPSAKPATLGAKPSPTTPSAGRAASGTPKPARTAAKPSDPFAPAKPGKPLAGLDLKKAPSDARKTGGLLKLGAAGTPAKAKPGTLSPGGKGTDHNKPASPFTLKKTTPPSTPAARRAGSTGKTPPGATDGPFQFSTASRRGKTGLAGTPAKPATPNRAGTPSAAGKKEPAKPFDFGKARASRADEKPASERFSLPAKTQSSRTASGTTRPPAAAPGTSGTARPAGSGSGLAGRKTPAAPVRTTARSAGAKPAAPAAKPLSPAATARAIPLTPDEEASAKLPAPVDTNAATKQNRTAPDNGLFGKFRKKT